MPRTPKTRVRPDEIMNKSIAVAIPTRNTLNRIDKSILGFIPLWNYRLVCTEITGLLMDHFS